MFPAAFANRVITKFTDPGDVVLDPFAGRATSVYSAATGDRIGVGIEVNPVGWVYGKAKLCPASEDEIVNRLTTIVRQSHRYANAAEKMPEFFHLCYTDDVRAFLLAARNNLNWRRNKVDRTLMALLLVSLHGKRTDSLSNQMRQTKAMSPPYAVRWWRKHNSHPPMVDPEAFLLKRIKWRYAKGRPKVTRSHLYLGDCNQVLPRLNKEAEHLLDKKVSLLFTSPPYCGVTNYHYDQWLRLWLLGGSEMPTRMGGFSRGRLINHTAYTRLLTQAFQNVKPMLAKDAIIYVRTDSRDFTLDTTLHVLRAVFPKKQVRCVKRPFHGPTQTHLFRNGSRSKGETDLILEP